MDLSENMKPIKKKFFFFNSLHRRTFCVSPFKKHHTIPPRLESQEAFHAQVGWPIFSIHKMKTKRAFGRALASLFTERLELQEVFCSTFKASFAALDLPVLALNCTFKPFHPTLHCLLVV